MSEKLCTLRTQGGGGGAKQTETVLWTNSAPTSSFNTQTVTLSDSIENYDYIKIPYHLQTTDANTASVILSVADFKKCLSGNNALITALGGRTATTWARAVLYDTATTVLFGLAYQMGGGGNTQNACIPTAIIGIKNMGGYASIKDYAFMFATSDGTRSVNRGYTSNSNVFTVAETAGSSATNTITVLEAGNYEYMAETGNRSTANCYVKIGDVTVSVGTTTSAAGNIYIPANTVCKVYTAPASSSINTATLTLIKK